MKKNTVYISAILTDSAISMYIFNKKFPKAEPRGIEQFFVI